ncbi:MAG: DUF433 domain-containing protein [Chloroflexi bacterium]|nr:DUF433 domain-containing protein [Chloroflexota bacterium]
MADVIQDHVEIVAGARGPKPRIVGSRIRVQDIAVWHEKLGMSPDDIVHEYPSIAIADVYAALACYWDHRDERAMREEQALASELRKRDIGPLRQKLKRQRHG